MKRSSPKGQQKPSKANKFSFLYQTECEILFCEDLHSCHSFFGSNLSEFSRSALILMLVIINAWPNDKSLDDNRTSGLVE